MWSKDRKAYENESANLDDEEQSMKEWRKFGLISVLFDVVASISTPQTRQLLGRLQRNEADAIGVHGAQR